MYANLLDIVHLADGLVGILFSRIANKTKAAATASIAILDDDLDAC